MKAIAIALIAIVTSMSPTVLFAETQTSHFEATKTKAAGSINPPNPKDTCDQAKQAVIEKAANAGFKGKVVWDHLSSDSDCKVSTTTAGSAGVFYTFKASGTFSK